jgi:hypothetical protein
VRRLLEDPEPWISAGREQAASLTWKHCADATWAAYLAAWRSARA